MILSQYLLKWVVIQFCIVSQWCHKIYEFNSQLIMDKSRWKHWVQVNHQRAAISSIHSFLSLFYKISIELMVDMNYHSLITNFL